MIRRLLGYEQDLAGRWRKGSWMATVSGGRFYPLDPRADEVHVDDLVSGISGAGRYANQTRDRYTVGEHSVIVSLVCEEMARARGWPEWLVLLVAREGLLHDASEAWIGDVVRPLKYTFAMRGYRRAEAKIMACVFERFGVTPTAMTSALVKLVDDEILHDEIDQLMVDPHMFSAYHTFRGVGATIEAMPHQQAAHVFARRFADLFPEEAMP